MFDFLALSELVALAAAADQLADALEETRWQMIEHAAQLPLKRRNHGPALFQADEALASYRQTQEGKP